VKKNKAFDAHIHLSESADDELWFYAKLNHLKYNLKELLNSMEENNVVSGLLLSPLVKGGGATPNNKILEFCKKSGDKLFPILTVEPKSQSVEEAISLAKKNGGYVKGFKIRLGYVEVYAGDKVFNPLYEFAESLDLPVLFHTGDTASSLGSLKHSHPLTLDYLARKRPLLKIIACHFGNPWIMDVAELIYKNENVYADISGMFTGGGKKYSNRYIDFLARKISEAIYYADGAQKVIFGSDYPIETIPAALKFANKLQVDKVDLQNILWNNSKKVFSFF
jgi:predicted TIM-barrel fold metal-dependent hydrolase